MIVITIAPSSVVNVLNTTVISVVVMFKGKTL